MGTTSPSAFIIFAIMCGTIRPTVERRFSIGSSVKVMKLAGEVSVIPMIIYVSILVCESETNPTVCICDLEQV